MQNHNLALKDERRFERWRTYEPGWIIDPQTTAKLYCILHNVSEGGASVEVDDANMLPDTFFLKLFSETFFTECAVVWRSGGRAGVEFVDEPVKSDRQSQE